MAAFLKSRQRERDDSEWAVGIRGVEDEVRAVDEGERSTWVMIESVLFKTG